MKQGTGSAQDGGSWAQLSVQSCRAKRAKAAGIVDSVRCGYWALPLEAVVGESLLLRAKYLRGDTYMMKFLTCEPPEIISVCESWTACS